jgi:Bacterial TniB protein
MTDPHGHLGPSALEVIALSPEERIAKIQARRFTEYPRCRLVLDLMREQIGQPGGVAKPNLLVWGESGQGKSTIMAKHLRDHPALFDKRACGGPRSSAWKCRPCAMSGGSTRICCARSMRRSPTSGATFR